MIDIINPTKDNRFNEKMLLTEVNMQYLNTAITDQLVRYDEDGKGVDYYEIFSDALRYGIANLDKYDDEDTIQECNYIKDNFYSFLNQLFAHYLGIGFEDTELMDILEKDEFYHMIYRYFIFYRNDNFIDFFVNYLTDKYINIREVKEEFMNKPGVISLDDLINDINPYLREILMSMHDDMIDVDDFFKYSHNCVENDFVNSKYDSFNITGNFVPKYYKTLEGELSEIAAEVVNKLRDSAV